MTEVPTDRGEERSMNSKTQRIFASLAGVLILSIFLGWRGSKLVQHSQTAQMEGSLQTEIGLAQEVVASRIQQFETEAFNVISAEYLQHSSRQTGATSELSESPYLAVGVLELKSNGYAPTWWSINPKARASVSADLLQSFMPDWQPSIQQMGRHLFLRAADLSQSPMMVFFSRIELPNAQSPAVAVVVLPPSAVKLNARAERGSYLWDSRGYIWGYENPSYIGARLKSDPLVHGALHGSDDLSTIRFVSNSHVQLGVYAHVPDSNLYVGFSRPVPGLIDILLGWWMSILIAVAGAGFISYVAFLWWKQETEEIELPPAVVEKPKRREIPVAFDPPEEIRPSELDPEVLKAPIAEPPQIAAASMPEEEKSAPNPVLDRDTISVDTVLIRALSIFKQRCGTEDVMVNESYAAGIHVKAKAAQLQTAIEEILKNALDAMKDSPERTLTIESAAENSNARITIRDTGCGIAAGDKEKIFEPFFTTKSEEARGLGLTVVKRLLELVKGEARVESEVGKGTAFTLLIPMPGKPVVKAKEEISPPPALERPLDEFDFMEDEELSSIQPMRIEQVRDIVKNVEIRKPKVRMFD